MSTITITRNPATERQVAYLVSLLERQNERIMAIDPDNGPEFALANSEWILDIHEGRTVLSKSDASKAIDKVKTFLTDNPLRQAPVVEAAPTLGYYLRDGAMYRIVNNRAGTRQYAKVLVVDGNHGRWEYAAGAMRLLTPAYALTPEQAAEFGHQNGICGICGAELTDPQSVARGVGPVCWANIGGAR